jgi:hypothetical protein
VVGHLLESQIGPQRGEVVEDGNDASVVGLEEHFDSQDGEQLVLGEVLAAELRRVRGQRLRGPPESFSGHRPWGLGHRV